MGISHRHQLPLWQTRFGDHFGDKFLSFIAFLANAKLFGNHNGLPVFAVYRGFGDSLEKKKSGHRIHCYFSSIKKINKF